MTTSYLVKSPTALTPSEIDAILKAWEVEAWQQLQPADFIKVFSNSEFHLLQDADQRLLSVARINFDFKLLIEGRLYAFPELVGFVSMIQRKGYGSKLLTEMIANLQSPGVETLGFCEKALRPFYEKNDVALLYGKAKFIREFENDEWIAATDDDIINLTLLPSTIALLQSLNE